MMPARLVILTIFTASTITIFGCKTSEKVDEYVLQTIDEDSDTKSQSQPELDAIQEPPLEICGVQDENHKPVDHHAPKTRLSSVQTAQKHSWPWHVLLKRIKGGQVVHECQAALVPVEGNRRKSDILITPAGCVTEYMENVPEDIDVTLDNHSVDIYPSELRAVAGLHDKNEAGAREYLVNRTLPYEAYMGRLTKDRRIYFADVAIVKLATPIPFSKRVKPICLPDDEDDQQLLHATCVITGFARPYGNDRTEPLKQVPVNIESLSACPGIDFPDPEETLICGTPGVSAWISAEDLGAPLSCLNKNDHRWYLQGAMLKQLQTADSRRYLLVHMSRFTAWITMHSRVMTSV